MRKNGFTLIELLAVIVILAIIALIATPIILGIINDAREKANERSVELYASAVRNAVAAYQLTGASAPTSFSDLNIQYDGEVECKTKELYSDGSFYIANCTVNGTEVDYTYGTLRYADMKRLDDIIDSFDVGNTPIEINTMNFYNDGRIPENKYTEIDVSVNGDRSVMMYFYNWSDYRPDDMNLIFTDVAVVSKGNEKISFPSNSSNLFADFKYPTFYFNDAIYTGNVEDMSGMFDTLLALGGLASSNGVYGLENWDTSNVTNMSNMFKNASFMCNLDLSNWDTSNVTDMSGMFEYFGNAVGCFSGPGLKLNNWDTSNVTNMSRMFNEASAPSLDLTSFDTSKVTDVSYMFNNNMIGEIKVSRSKWNVSKANQTNFISSLESLGTSELTYVD